MSGKSSFEKVAKQLNSGKRYPALQLINRNTDAAAIVSKLVKNQIPQQFDISKPDTFYNLNTSQFSAVNSSISERMGDSENIMQLFPDLELSAQILISSILSPKDMTSTDILYKVSEPVMSVDVMMQTLKVVEDTINNHYKFKTILPDILREALFISGAYVKVVIPESSIDAIINSNLYPAVEGLNITTESIDSILKRPSLGILGNAKPENGRGDKFSFESFKTETYDAKLYIPNNIGTEQARNDFSKLIEVTDNFKHIHLPGLISKLRQARVSSIVNRVATEGITNPEHQRYTFKDIEQMFYKKADTKEVPFVSVKTRDQTIRSSVGRPLELKLPTEATIPVYIPGDPKAHVGYFIVLDEEGNPITYESCKEAMSQVSNIDDKTNSISSMLTQKAAYNLLGTSRHGINMSNKTDIYMSIIESDLLARLKNGVTGSKLEIARQTEVYQIMMARTLAGQYTRLLYLPAELVSYFALKFHPNGTGKSLLDDLKVLTSLRAILLFAKVMATAKNSINITHVNMTLDPNDPDPQKTIEMSINEVMKMRQQYFPLGINSPIDLVNWVQRAGFEFTFEGHPGLPQTKFDFESKSFQHQLPDSELEDTLRKQTIMALGLSPETVDNGFNSEFATTVISNNILLSKRVMQFQEQLTPIMTDYAKKILLNDFTLRKEIYDIIEENLSTIDKYLTQEEIQLKDADQHKFINYIIDKLAERLELDLPKPDITTVETQTAAFDQYLEALDKSLDFWISSEFMTSEVAGEFSNSVDAIRSNMRAYFVRKWMAENGYMSELADMISTDDEGDPVINLYDMTKEHIQGLMTSALKFMESIKKTKEAADKDIENLNVDGSGPSESSSYDSSSDSDDDSGSGDSGGDDDMGLNMGDTEDFASLGNQDSISEGDVEDVGKGE